MTKTITFSWDTIKDGLDVLEEMIRPLRPHLIVGIARGGLVPATMLSHRLNVHLETISASSYEGTRRTLQKPTIIEGWQNDYDSKHVVIVDDILDSGNTLAAIQAKGHAHMFHFACLVNKQCPRFPNHKTYFAQVPQGVWVNFPWEQGYDDCIGTDTSEVKHVPRNTVG